MFETLAADVRYAARSLALRPAYAATVLFILALTIGATTAAFSIVNGAILKPIPYDEPDQLVEISNADGSGRSDVLNVEAIDQLRNINQSFQSVALMASLTPLPDRGENYLVRVPADFFSDLLRVDPILGRHFTAADEDPGATPVVMISHAYWQDRLGADPGVIGRAIQHPEYGQLVVTGVLPSGFRSPEDLEDPAPFWAPFGSAPMITPDRSFPAIGRLRPGVTIEEARAEFSTILPGVIEAGGVWMSGRELQIGPMANRYTSANERGTIFLFFGAVVMLLMVGIANLAGLELARLPQFENELSVRSAMGASAWSLARLMVFRTLALGLAGGLLGAWVATLATSAFARTLPSYIPRPFDVGADRNVWLFAIGVSVLSSVLISLVPAIRASKTNLGQALQRATRSATVDRKYRLYQDGMSSVQIAMTVTLLVVGGIALHSFWRMATVDWGFDPDRVAVIQIRPSSESPQGLQTLFDDFRSVLRPMSEGGVVAIAGGLPGFGSSSRFLRAPGGPAFPPDVPGVGGRWYDGLVAEGFGLFDSKWVSIEYFDILGIPLIEGRPFTEAEARNSAPVAIVSASAARVLWPGESPVGQRIQQGFEDREPIELTVVGVVGDIRGAIRDQEMERTVYSPAEFSSGPQGTMAIVRTTADARQIEGAITQVDPQARVDVVWMTDRFAVQIDRDKFYGFVLAAFSAIALVLAAMGVYSIVSYSVDRRVREIGVRMALGAGSGRVFFETLRRVGIPSLIGLVLGVGGAWIVQPILERYLYSIEPADSIAYAYVLPLLVVAVIVAGTIPSARASRLNPLEALRHE